MAFLDHYSSRKTSISAPINGANGSTRVADMPMPPQHRNRGDYDSDLSSMSMKRSYDAAIPTVPGHQIGWRGLRPDRLKSFTPGAASVIWLEILSAIILMLERSFERLGLNVIGPNGIRLQPRVKNLKGPNLNEKLNTAIGDAWTEFRTKGMYDVTGQYSGILADNMALRAMARDGGCLLKFHRGYRGNKYRFAVQLLEVDALDLWYNKILDEQRIVTEGVEVDGFGKPINYHLLKYSEADLMANSTIGQRVVVPARDMIHAWLPERITSVRGVSWFASVLLKLRMLDKFEEATAIAKRTTAAKMGFFEQTPVGEQYQGQGELPTGETINEVNPGSLEVLPVGISFKPFDPGKSGGQLSRFPKSYPSIRGIRLGTDV